MENSFSLLSLFSGRDLMTLFVSLVLVGASILSWAVIIEKIRLWNYQKHNPVTVKHGDNLETIVDKLIRPFDKNLWFLSMVSYVAPFIGLFGTVLGVMRAFSDLANISGAGPSVVAKGIAEALVNTAAGLFVAVPALIAYNYFLSKVNFFAKNMQYMAQEVISAKLYVPQEEPIKGKITDLTKEKAI